MAHPSQAKALIFRALHERPQTFVIPNPWDAGSARLLAQLGFEALATTSAGYAYSQGLRDNQVGRDAMLEHVRILAAATPLPLNADLENGYGDAPEDAAQTITLAAEAGAVGGSIEDATGRPADPIYDLQHAVDRIRAAVEAARALPFPFILTARAENFLHGRPDLADTIRRLQAYQDAGADVLYAPGLRTREEIAELLRSVDRPVNVLAGPQPGLAVANLAALGVRRISLGSGLARVAYGAFLQAAAELQQSGTFDFLQHAIPYRDINSKF